MGTASFFFCCCFLTNCHYAVPFLVLLPLFFFSSLFVSLNLLNVVIRFVFSATNFRAIQQLPCSFFSLSQKPSLLDTLQSTALHSHSDVVEQNNRTRPSILHYPSLST